MVVKEYQFRETVDSGLIKEYVMLPNNRRYNFDDGHSPDNYSVVLRDDYTYIEVLNSGISYGIIVLIEINSVVAEAHLCFKPSAYGQVSRIGIECLEWISKNTTYTQIVAPVVQSNRLAVRCIEKIGLRQIGMLDGCWLRDGKLENYLIYSINI